MSNLSKKVIEKKKMSKLTGFIIFVEYNILLEIINMMLMMRFSVPDFYSNLIVSLISIIVPFFMYESKKIKFIYAFFGPILVFFLDLIVIRLMINSINMNMGFN